MRIIDYFRDERQEHWLSQIRLVKWQAARLLESMLAEGTFHALLGEGTLYLLADGDTLVSFLTLAERDCIDDTSLTPWIGFVHTAPEYRGQRCAGRLLDYAVRAAGEQGAPQVYICTDHVGLYEKYGFVYMENRVSIYGEDSRILVRRTVMPPVRVERVTADNVRPDSLDGFVRHQQVCECWRCVDGQWMLLPIAFTEHWDADRLRAEAAELIALSAAGKPAFVAKQGDDVVGFASLGGRLGIRGQYMELLSLHVSKPWRGQGVGRALFAAVCTAAREAGAEKLYISAHSSKESQAVYRALGCALAQEPDAAHVTAEPCDVQMEYDLYRPLDVRFGRVEDLVSWMKLVRLVAWNFPGLETEQALAEYEATAARFIGKGNAICAVEDEHIVGVLLFSRSRNQLCFMAVSPQVRRRGAAQAMFDLMLTIADPDRDLTVTTFREGDPMGIAARAFYARQGFVPEALVMENGYPCQCFVRRAENAKG